MRADIVSGRLLPGKTLVIDSLAKRFDVSIIPVREALRQLQAERLVEIRPHTGTRVTAIDASDLEEIFAMLTALETASIAAAVKRLDEEGMQALEDELAHLEAAEAKQDVAKFEEANRRFHLLPCQIAGHTRVAEGMRATLAEWERLHRLAFRGASRPDIGKSNAEHRAMVRAFRARDEVKLTELIKKHNDSAAKHYQKSQAPEPGA